MEPLKITGTVNEKKAWGISLAVNLLLLFLCISFGNLYFGAIDDYFMARILEGVYGNDYNVHLTFVNALYGYLLLPLYHLFPKIGWYYVGEMASIFISFSVICYFLIRQTGVKWGTLCSLLFVSLFASDYYLVLQFTQCAAVLAAAGMLSFVFGVVEQKKSSAVIFLIMGTLLLFWGSVMRWPAFLMGLPFGAFALLLLYPSWKSHKKRVAFGILGILIGVVAIYEFNQLHYQAPDYKAYMEFQGPRSLFGDGAFYDAQAVYEDMEELNYSGGDVSLLKLWNFYDPEVFSLENLKPIIESIDRHRFESSVWYIPGDLLGTLTSLGQTPVLWAWFIFCLLVMLFNKPKSLYAWGSLILIFGILFGLHFVHRVVYRVETGAMLYAAVLAVPFLKNLPHLPKKIVWVITFALGAINVCSYSMGDNMVRSPNKGVKATMDYQKDTVDYKGFMEYVESTPDSTVFIMAMNPYMSLSHRKNPPYLSEPMGSWKQIVSFGFWTPFFPDVDQSLRERGVTNPMKDVVKENVFVVDNSGLTEYLQRHYYDSVQVKTLKNLNGLHVYKYFIASSKEEEP